MVFSSAYFLLLFLPLFLLLYFLVRPKYRNLVMLIGSLYFYIYGEKVLVLILVFSTLVDYKCGLLIEEGKRKLGLRISLFSNLITLGVFKYFNFFIENFYNLFESIGIDASMLGDLPKITLPLGISFYVFQTMSYTIDVYNGNVKANRNLLNFATYVTMFPQLVAGPIVRYIDIHNQLQQREISVVKFGKGLERFILGLAKKMIIANAFGAIADNIFSTNITDLSTANAWIGIIAYSFQIYYDFSAYSDMAIGLGKMLGFDFLENFNYPYISKSIQEFWRRWHISLSTWFRDYLYIPLGGNRQGPYKTYFNLFVVFFVTGLWHGAAWNFIIWGLFHGLFLIIERLGFNRILKQLWTPFQHLYTLLIVIIGWVLFRADNLKLALIYIKRMFVFSEGDATTNTFIEFFNYNPETIVISIIAVVFSMPVYLYIENNIKNKAFAMLRYPLVIALLLVCITYIAAGSYNPFIYFRF